MRMCASFAWFLPRKFLECECTFEETFWDSGLTFARNSGNAQFCQRITPQRHNTLGTKIPHSILVHVLLPIEITISRSDTDIVDFNVT